MSGNSGTGGLGRFSREALAHSRELLAYTPPRPRDIAEAAHAYQSAELYELGRLIAEYPNEARRLLAEVDPGP